MSQKNLRKRRLVIPRAMPVETIVTRYKSAQKKNNHEQNKKKTTKNKVYMRSNTSNRIPASVTGDLECLAKKKPIKSKQKLNEIETNEEYYPEKLRRPLLNKKVVLVPKPTYKLVGDLNTLNKRKLKRPTKEIPRSDSFNCLLNEEEPLNEPELSIIDMISIQDNDNMDDEDFLEILTCPSPVWWEDPPLGYDEDPLPARIQNVDTTNGINQQKVNSNVNDQNKLNKIFTQVEQNGFTSNALSINVNIKKDKNFVTRQNKLETLLGSLKNKKTNTAVSISKKLENTNYNNSSSNSPECERQKRTSESCDEEVLDGSYDEILKTFENIDIPIKNTSNDKEANSMEKAKSKIKVLKLDTGIKSPHKVMPVKGLTIKKCDIRKFKPNKKNVMMTNKTEQNMAEIKKNKMLIIKSLSEYCDMKIVKKNTKNMEMSKTETKHSFKREHSAQVKGITIQNWDWNLMRQSNKNIRTIKRKGENKKDEITSGKVNVLNNNEINSEGNTSDTVTVFKILHEQDNKYGKKNTEPKLELNNEYNTQLNSYYNQCKNINKKKETDNVKNKLVTSDCSDANSTTVKSISVSDDETVKYCLQCSSIFDTDICKYCINKFNGNHQQDSYTEHLKNLHSDKL